MNEILKDRYVKTLQEQSLLEPENRQTLIVRTNNCFLSESPDVEYPAKLNQLIAHEGPEGELEGVIAMFDLVDGPNRVYSFKARIGSTPNTESQFPPRDIKQIRPIE